MQKLAWKAQPLCIELLTTYSGARSCEMSSGIRIAQRDGQGRTSRVLIATRGVHGLQGNILDGVRFN
jgi:hypothetical protein